MFEFQITNRDKKARTGILKTPHGYLSTPSLAIVATEGRLKGIEEYNLQNFNIDYIIANTFHLWIKKLLPNNNKTIHNISGLKIPTASDSGGFQVFSLGFGKSHNIGKIGNIFPGQSSTVNDTNNPIKINENGVIFNYDNKKILLTPELSMHIQHKIGADIMFAFDECTSPFNSKRYTYTALERTHSWLKRCIAKHNNNDKQALFAIVQGGEYKDLRLKSSLYMGSIDVPGYGIGGSLGKTKQDMLNVIEWSCMHLPYCKPRHLLGIGQIRDIFESVERGVDLFDCVIPTREARHGALYTKKGRIAVRKYKTVDEIIDKGCSCSACSQKISLKTLYFLYKQKNKQALYYMIDHNINFFYNLMDDIAFSIKKKQFLSCKEEYLKYY